MCQKRIKNYIHFVTKCSFCHFCLVIKSKNFFYKKSSYFHPLEKCDITGLKMTFISPQRVRSVTFLSNHRIKNFFLQKVFVFLTNRKICQKRIENDIYFVTKCSFRHFLCNHQIKKLLLQKVFYSYLIENV